MKRGAVRWCRSGRSRGSIGRSPGGGKSRGPSYPKGVVFAKRIKRLLDAPIRIMETEGAVPGTRKHRQRAAPGDRWIVHPS